MRVNRFGDLCDGSVLYLPFHKERHLIYIDDLTAATTRMGGGFLFGYGREELLLFRTPRDRDNG